jgi:hypothetical protein
MAIHDNYPDLLTRAQAGAVLRAHGYPVSDKSLASLACRGGGPPFHKFGRRPLYYRNNLFRWAHEKLGGCQNSTSQQPVHDDECPF